MLKTTVISFALAVGLGVSALAVAQSAPAQQVAGPTGDTHSGQANAAQDHQVIKPGDRNCIRDTGSLIPAKKGQCLQGVNGRSYTLQELRNTGAINNAQALRMLDPSIH
ncbi:hypothetical protein B0E46_00935 [Rhodanobacter sp. B04]|uniref:hypothetical protein n=1 Tax=Rhodanobacter sp. B04 TaxID=1945860 RepID=UPI000985E801|nr:hypothetical protein [Rhodanobacter sp. B04]OOG66099.1 hypothetical protein B0E46_00935 [Rhodanobacter sp. B04]